MTTTKSYDNLNRLTQIASVPSASPTVSFANGYNDANQRTAVTNVDDSHWAYGYGALGQVTSGKKYWSNTIPVAGQQFECRRASRRGPAKAAHDEAAAAALAQGLGRLGVDGGQLEQMARSAPEKMVLACWLRQRSPVSLRWLGERLAMGRYTRVSHAIGVVQRGPNRFHKRVQRRLKKVWHDEKCGP